MNGIIEWLIHLMEILGAPGVGIAILLENLFPPIPSEVILPLAGFTISQGTLGFWPTFIWATAGSIIGAWVLYGVGAWIGAQRLRRIADWMWLGQSYTVVADYIDRYSTVVYALIALMLIVVTALLMRRNTKRKNAARVGLPKDA